jgi:hypothetical protein
MKYAILILCLIYSINSASAPAPKLPARHHIALALFLKMSGARGSTLQLARRAAKQCPSFNVINLVTNATKKMKARLVFLKRALKVKKLSKKVVSKTVKNFKLALIKSLLRCRVVSNSKRVTRVFRHKRKAIRKAKKVRTSVLRAVRRMVRKVLKPKRKVAKKPKKTLKKKVKITFAPKKKTTRKAAKKAAAKRRKVSRKTKRNIRKLAKKTRKVRRMRRRLVNLKARCLKGKKNACRRVRRLNRKLRRTARRLRKSLKKQHRALRRKCVTKKTKAACALAKVLRKKIVKIRKTVRRSQANSKARVVAKQLYAILLGH